MNWASEHSEVNFRRMQAPEDAHQRKGKKTRKNTCWCHQRTSRKGSQKEPRFLLRALSFRKRVNYTPIYSVWEIRSYCLMHHIEDEPHVDKIYFNADYVPGLSKWKKMLKKRNRSNKLNDWVKLGI